jgi:hypothetical protein
VDTLWPTSLFVELCSPHLHGELAGLQPRNCTVPAGGIHRAQSPGGQERLIPPVSMNGIDPARPAVDSWDENQGLVSQALRSIWYGALAQPYRAE